MRVFYTTTESVWVCQIITFLINALKVGHVYTQETSVFKSDPQRQVAEKCSYLFNINLANLDV